MVEEERGEEKGGEERRGEERREGDYLGCDPIITKDSLHACSSSCVQHLVLHCPLIRTKGNEDPVVVLTTGNRGARDSC